MLRKNSVVAVSLYIAANQDRIQYRNVANANLSTTPIFQHFQDVLKMETKSVYSVSQQQDDRPFVSTWIDSFRLSQNTNFATCWEE